VIEFSGFAIEQSRSNPGSETQSEGFVEIGKRIMLSMDHR